MITDEPAAARDLVHRIEAARAIVRRKLAGVPGVSVFLDVGFFTTVSNQSLAGDMLREVHARNVAGPAAESGPFDLLELRGSTPSLLPRDLRSGTSLALLRRNPKTRKLAAVLGGRFAIVDSATFDPGRESATASSSWPGSCIRMRFDELDAVSGSTATNAAAARQPCAASEDR